MTSSVNAGKRAARVSSSWPKVRACTWSVVRADALAGNAQKFNVHMARTRGRCTMVAWAS